MEGKILKAPLVVIQKIDENIKPTYYGFVPGITNRDVICSKKSDCEAQLKEVAVKAIKDLIKSKKAFPRFPDSKEIHEDFENVVSIKYISIHI